MARHDQDFWSPGDQGVRSTDQVPRWLTVLAVCVGLAVAIVLLRYAIDLLGLVFVIVAVGFSIRALTDWLTDVESVSLWSIAAVCIGLVGTLVVGTWLFGSSGTRAGRIDLHLPTFVSETIAWAEAKGWGDRVLLSGVGQQQREQRGSQVPPDVQPIGTSDAGEPAPAEPHRSDKRTRAGRSAGDERPAVSTSGTALLTSTTLSVAPAVRAPFGRPVRLTATVQTEEKADLPDGTVVFWRDGVVLGSATLRTVDDRAVAQLTTSDLPTGEIGLSAEYVGTAHFRTSRSAVRQIAVEP